MPGILLVSDVRSATEIVATSLLRVDLAPLPILTAIDVIDVITCGSMLAAGDSCDYGGEVTYTGGDTYETSHDATLEAFKKA